MFHSRVDDESRTSRLEEWMNSMSFHISFEYLKKINSCDFAQSVLETVAKRICPENVVEDAKYVLLYKDVLLSSDQNKNCTKSLRAELQLMNRRNQLKERLRPKENELTEKDKEYTELIKRNTQLLQEAQKICNILKEVNKKALYLLLNEQKLEENVKLWKSLRKTVSELKKIETPEDCNFEVTEMVRICQVYIRDLRKKAEKQSVEFPDENSDYKKCDNSTAHSTWKQEISFVRERSNAFPCHMILEALLAQQKELTQSIQSALNIENFNTGCESVRTTNTEQKIGDQKLKILHEEIVNAVLQQKHLGKVGGTHETRLYGTSSHSHSSATEEDNVNECLHYTDHLLQETLDNCKEIKSQLKESLKKITPLKLQIKKFPKLFEAMQKRGGPSAVSLNDLRSSVEPLCKIGLKEIQFFSKIPLAAIEKVSFSKEKRIPVYKLVSSYHRVLCTSGVNLSSFSVMQGASSVVPHDLLLSVWNQLMYLWALRRCQDLMKPFVGIDMELNLQNVCAHVPTEMNQMYKAALTCVSQFESTGNEIDQLSSIMSKASLNAAVPRNLLVDGESIGSFTEVYNKLPRPDNSFDTTLEESI